MVELENYLRNRKANHPNEYEHSVEHLVINTSLTRERIEKAAKRSAKLNLIPRQDRNGMAIGYRVEWRGKP